MPLQEQVVELNFAGGLKEAQEQFLQSEGFAAMENCYQQQDGALVKLAGANLFANTMRAGIVPGEATPGANPRLLKRGGMVGQIANGYLYAKADQWIPQGYASPWVLDQRSVCEIEALNNIGVYQDSRLDCARSGNWLMSVWEMSNVLAYALTYLPTGETAIINTQAGIQGARPIVRDADGSGTFLLFYLSTVTGQDLFYRYISASAVGAEQAFSNAILGAAGSAPNFDVVTDVASQRVWAIMLGRTTGNVVHSRWSIGVATLTNLSSGTLELAATPSACAVCVNTASNTRQYVWSKWNGAGPFTHQLRGLVMNATNDTVSVPATTLWSRGGTSAVKTTTEVATVQKIGLASSGGTNFFCSWTDPNPTAGGGEFSRDIPAVRAGWIVGGAAFAFVHFAGSVRVQSRPWVYGAKGFLLVSAAVASGLGTDPNSFYALVGIDLQTNSNRRLVPFGFFGYLSAPRATNTAPDGDADLTRISTPWVDANGMVHVQWIERDAGLQRAKVRDGTLAIDDRVGKFSEFGGATYFTGAMLWAWDGIRTYEAAFLQQPYILGPAFSAGALPNGTRLYKVTFARVTASGEIIRSRPSDLVSFTNVAQSNAVNVNVPTLNATGDGDASSLYLEIWRTKDAQVTPYYLVVRILVPPNQRDIIGFVDSVTDAALTVSPQPGLPVPSIYTDGSTGSELANDPPPPPVHITVWQNRLWITDGDQLAYSKEGVAGRGAEFSGFQVIPKTLPCPKLTALASLGETLAVFGQDVTGYVYGDGPAANGEGSTLVGPIKVQGDIGCMQPAGMLELPGGVIVPSRRGIRLLDQKSREYSYIGEDIERTYSGGAAGPVFARVRAAAWDESRELAWFTLANTLNYGFFAIYDTRHRTWSYGYPDYFRGQQRSPRSVVFVGTQQTFSDEDTSGGSGVSHTYDVNVSATTINGVTFRQLLLFPWAKVAGSIGEMRIRKLWVLLRQFGSTSGLKLQLNYNYEVDNAIATPPGNEPIGQFHSTLSSADITAAVLSGTATAFSASALRFPSPPRQRCVAFQLALVEQADALARGLQFSGLRIAVGLRQTKGALTPNSNQGGGFVAG